MDVMKPFRWSLKWQLLTAILGVMLTTLLLYTWIAGNLLMTALDRSMTSRLTLLADLAKVTLPLGSMTGYLDGDEATQVYARDVARLQQFAANHHLDRITLMDNQGLVRIDTGAWTPGSATGLSHTVLQNSSGILTRLHRNRDKAWRKMFLTRMGEGHMLRFSAGAEMFAVIDQVRMRRTLILGIGILLAIGLSFGLAFLLGKRFSQLSGAFRVLQTGDHSVRIPVRGNDELAFLSRSFNEMAEELEHITRQERLQHAMRISELKVLSAGVAHEIRNPLSAISGLAELLARRPEIREREENLDLANRILNEINRLNRIVVDVMAYARQPQLDVTVVPFTDLRQAILETDPGCSVTLSDGSGTLRADRGGLMTILRNLVLNARQAAGPEGRVETVISLQDGHAIIEVRDSGPGIAPDEMQNIFQPFYTKKSGGTGLGLAITRNIAEAHGGTLACRSEAEHTVFVLTLPQAKES